MVWETVILQLVFSLPYADKLLFKGGTTLAKAGLIERMRELENTFHNGMEK